MRPPLDSAGHQVLRTKPTCLLHTWRPHRPRPFAFVLHLHQHQSSGDLHLQYLAKNQSTPCCKSLITRGSDHPPVLEPHRLSTAAPCCMPWTTPGRFSVCCRSSRHQGTLEQASLMRLFHEEQCFVGSLFRGDLRNLVFFLGLSSRCGGVGHLPSPHRESPSASDVTRSPTRCSSNSDLPGNTTPPRRQCFML
jgi:hypothetical protein